MATIDSQGRLHGKAGSVVYRVFRGTQVAQGPTKPFRQTRASKESACEFGLASTSARAIRQAFSPIHHDRHDKGVVNRMNSVVYRAIRASSKERGGRDIHDAQLDLLEGFEFNVKSPFAKALLVKPEVGLNEKGQVRVRIPEIDVKKDIRATAFAQNREGGRYQIKFVLTGFNFREGFYEFIGIKEVLIPKPGTQRVPAQELVFEGEVPKGCFLLLAASFAYQTKNEAEGYWENMNTEEFSPGAILAAFPARDEAEKGYGASRISEANDRRERGADGAAWPVVHKGKELLEKIKGLQGKKKGSKLKDEISSRGREVPSGLPGDEGGGLTGKRVKLNL